MNSTPQRLKSCAALCAAFLAGLGAAAEGNVIDPREVNLLASAMVVDAESALLTTVAGLDQSSILRYGALVGAWGWRGHLTGNYGGYEVDIGYRGDTRPVPSYPGASIGDPIDLEFASHGTLTCVSYPCLAGPLLTWSDEGSWTYILTEDPVSISTAQLTPTLGPDGRPQEFSLTIGAGTQVWSIDLGIEKNFDTKEFTVEITGAILDGLARAGGSFSFNQQTGRDESALKASALFGLFSWRRTIDETQLFTPKDPIANPQDIDPLTVATPPAVPAPPLPEVPIPEISIGSDGQPVGTPGFMASPDLPYGQEYMYVRNIPEPATIVLVGLGFAGLCLRRCTWRIKGEQAER